MRGGAPAVAAVAVTLAGCGSAGHTAPATTRPATTVVPATAPAPAAKPKPRVHHRPKPPPDPGKLPQTDRLPSTSGHAFRTAMAALWDGVRRNSVHAARPAFFPESAYVQVKAIGDPAADWSERLLRDYGLDLSAAHALLGSRPEQARLLRVIVPAAYVHWVDPGACYNGVGYYEVANSRVVYRQHGEVQSFGIASMISWRGVWYVIHLGSITGPSGVVDEPSSGEGESAPSSTC